MNQLKNKNYNRDSKIIKLGRVYQKYSQYISFVDYLFRLPLSLSSRKNSKIPVIVIIAPPRSGSTLAYQLLTTGIKSFHLTNIWNLLYATPTLGGLISQRLCRGYHSKFKSCNGFVPGICGEAEGLKFWSYWTGQMLEENNSKFNIKKAQKLINAIKLLNKDDIAFITGYLGHIFCMHELRKIFSNIIFVHITRDLLSNAYSLFNLSKQDWFSLKPKEYIRLQKLPSHHRVISQLISIHKKILNQSNPSDTIKLDYSEICENPIGVIKKIIAFAKNQNIKLYLQKNAYISKKFPQSKVKYNLNNDTIKIYQYIEKELAENGEIIKRLYLNIK